MSDEEHTGTCMAGERCKLWDGKKPAPQWPLCEADLFSADRDVRQLLFDYRDLEQQLPPSLGVWGDGQPRGKSTPLPLSEHVLDLQREIWWVTTAWEDVLRDRCGLSMKADWSKRQRFGRATQQALAIIEPRVRLLAEVGQCEMWGYPGSEGWTVVDGWQGVLDLAKLHQRARSALGLTREEPELLLGVLCRNCDIRSKLYRELGGDGVRCKQCNEYYTAGEYADWVALLDAEVKRDGIVVPRG